MRSIVALLILATGLLPAWCGAVNLGPLRLPEGFRIGVYAENVPNVRQLALGADGTVYAGTRQAGKVYAIRDIDGNQVADKIVVLDEDRYLPNGVAVVGDALYVAEVNRVLRYDAIARHLDNPPEPVVVYEQLPSDRHHGWKYLRLGPDGKLYYAVGAPCNICLSEKEIYATVVRMNPDGSDFEIYARGVRNTVGMDWHPETGELWFTENGRDWLGDDVPPDELNRAARGGLHFGYPYCHGGTIADPEFGKQRPCSEFTPPEYRFRAHNAPLGMRFYTGERFPEEYRGDLFVAQHGSWNRSIPDGYRILRVKFEGGKPVGEEIFVEGWLGPDGEAWGRPVDILQMPDGALLISDDTAGVIYRVSYGDS